MTKKTIIFGDIHACYEEWSELLDKIGPSKSDQLIAVGDLICKGPSTKKTLDLAKSLPNLQCIMGNHEKYLVDRWRKKELGKVSKDYQRDAIAELGKNADEYFKWISEWPYYIEMPDYIALHAGLKPGIPLKKQLPEDLAQIRTVEPDGKPWYDYYEGKKLIVHGHWAKQGLVVRKNVIGLDTGCVYGRQLTAVILPERKIVSVHARRVYSSV